MVADARGMRDRLMRLAYGHCRLGNREMAQEFLTRANSCLPVTKAQIKFLNKLYEENKNQGKVVRIESAAMNKSF